MSSEEIQPNTTSATPRVAVEGVSRDEHEQVVSEIEKCLAYWNSDQLDRITAIFDDAESEPLLRDLSNKLRDLSIKLSRFNSTRSNSDFKQLVAAYADVEVAKELVNEVLKEYLRDHNLEVGTDSHEDGSSNVSEEDTSLTQPAHDVQSEPMEELTSKSASEETIPQYSVGSIVQYESENGHVVQGYITGYSEDGTLAFLGRKSEDENRIRISQVPVENLRIADSPRVENAGSVSGDHENIQAFDVQVHEQDVVPRATFAVFEKDFNDFVRITVRKILPDGKVEVQGAYSNGKKWQAVYPISELRYITSAESTPSATSTEVEQSNKKEVKPRVAVAGKEPKKPVKANRAENSGFEPRIGDSVSISNGDRRTNGVLSDIYTSPEGVRMGVVNIPTPDSLPIQKQGPLSALKPPVVRERTSVKADTYVENGDDGDVIMVEGYGGVPKKTIEHPFIDLSDAPESPSAEPDTVGVAEGVSVTLAPEDAKEKIRASLEVDRDAYTNVKKAMVEAENELLTLMRKQSNSKRFTAGLWKRSSLDPEIDAARKKYTDLRREYSEAAQIRLGEFAKRRQ
jgi:hypothetical protein